MKFLNVILLTLFYQISFGQDTTIYLHSWKKPNRIDQISNNVYVNINFDKIDANNKISSGLYGGVILFVNKDKIIMSIDNEELEKELPDGTNIRSNNYYSLKNNEDEKTPFISIGENVDKRRLIHLLQTIGNHDSFSDSMRLSGSETLRAIDINSINNISYSESKKASDVGMFFTVMSGFAALVVAPLVSINYKTGNFNQTRYYSVLAGCGAGLAIGIPLAIIFNKTKSYRIKNYVPDPCDNNYYSVQTK